MPKRRFDPCAFLDQLDSLREAPTTRFTEMIPAGLLEAAFDDHPGARWRATGLYTPEVTLSAFASQVLAPGRPCKKVVDQIRAVSIDDGPTPFAPCPASYIRARARLDTDLLDDLATRLGRDVQRRLGPEGRWRGHRVLLLDGTTFRMPDTPENQEAFPQPVTQRPGLGYPQARAVVLTSLASGVMLGLATGAVQGKGTGETTLARGLDAHLDPGDLVICDRIFDSYFGLARWQGRGVEVLARTHQGRKLEPDAGLPPGVDDRRVTLEKPQRPTWMTREEYDALPPRLEVRILRFAVESDGEEAEGEYHEVSLTTTLSDASRYSKEDLAAMYRERWQVELDIRAAKSTLGMGVLRCRRPEMIAKEIAMHVLVYNVVRSAMVAASRATGVPVRELSFAGAMSAFAVYASAVRERPWTEPWQYAAMLESIASRRVGDRPGRVEPRKVKTRSDRLGYLTEPRQEARERLRKTA